MEDENKTRRQLIEELRELRLRLAAFEKHPSRDSNLEEALRFSKRKFSDIFNLSPDYMGISNASDGRVLSERDIADRKRTENALRESEAKFRNLADSSSSGIFLIQGTKFVYVNPAFGSITGYTADDLTEMHFWEVVHPDCRELVKERAFERLKGENPPSRYEILFMTKDGHTRWIDYSGSIIELDNKPAIIGSLFDISARKQAERRLKESENLYRTIFENTGTGIVIIAEDTTIALANSQSEKLTGYKREEIEGNKSWTEFVAKEDLERMLAQHRLRRINKDAAEKHCYFRLIDAQGNRRIFHLTMDMIPETKKSIASFIDVTEYKRSEEMLRESQQQFLNIINFLPDATVVIDSDRKIIAWNRAMEEMTGIKKENMIGQESQTAAVPFYGERRQFLLHMIDVSDEELKSRYQYVQRKGSSLYAETLAPSLYNGRGAYVWATAAPLVDANGNRIGAIESIRDITERRLSEEKYKSIFDNAVMGIFHTTPDGRYLSSNPAGFKMYGYESADDMIGSVTDMSRQTYVNPKERAKFKDILESKGRIEAFEVEHYRKDKSRIWVVLNSRAVRDNDDRILYYETIIEDITERKQSEILYKTLADASHAGVYIVQDGKFQFVNPHIPEYSGYSESELIGKDSFSFVHPDDRAQLRVNTIAMLKGKRNNPYEYRIIDRNGRIRWLMETVRSITYGGKRAVLGNTMDITERYQMENLLRQAQKMQAIGTLAGGIAHDFNNILMAIMGYTEMALVSPEVSERVRRYLDQVFKASKRARDLVKQILAFSRRSDEKPRPLKVSPIVRETLKLLRASLPSTIQIHQEIDVELDVVLADPTQIHQILMNLCTNAGHAMNGRKGELRVSLCPVEIHSCDDLSIQHGLSPGVFLQLKVGDTGVGIAPDILDRIYDPFFTTKKPGEGTGMGLSVVYGIVKSFGGAITVESEVEKGSRFNVYLPLLMEEEIEWESEDSSPVVGGRERILIVDDEANLVELGMELLSNLGYDVTGRTSSLEALELFRVKPDSFDLVITDMTMPNMTGVDLAREMTIIRPDLPIILCTGFSEMISMEKATSFGIRRFITKPLLIKNLAMAIREVLDTR